MLQFVYDDFAGLSSDLSFQWVLGGNFADGKGNMVMTFQYEDIGTVFTGDVDRYYNKETGIVELVHSETHTIQLHHIKQDIQPLVHQFSVITVLKAQQNLVV